ncbi:MAG: FmdE family protein [Candidatus Omnitrophica bacterium]|nr:FmdE family protein [Candidatus Omnitrophota bacterium]
MSNKIIGLKEAIKFHGHLGPYLVLGLLAGRLGLKKTGAKKYFGLDVCVYGANKKPKSCLIDGLQLSTGSTYGKGNIQKRASRNIKIIMRNPENNKKLSLFITEQLKNKLDDLKGHRDSEKFAKGLFNLNTNKIFEQQ